MKPINLMEMLKVGVHFGHKTSLWNPKMAPYIYTQRNNIHILDLEKTKNKLQEALNYAKDLAAKGGTILFVGTKRQAKSEVRKAAELAGMPYVVTRWLGGTFTNFRTIQRTIKKMERYEKMVADNEIKKYTKKEQLMIKREIDKMNNFFSGIKDMKKLPDAIFVLDAKYDHIPVEEARQTKVKVIGLVDTNSDPTKVNYVIPSNDDAIKVISYMANAMAEAILEGKGKYVQVTQEAAEAKAKQDAEAKTVPAVPAK
jgi:small subunit ribosomal protein S2